MEVRSLVRGERVTYRATDPTGATFKRGTVVATRPGPSLNVRIRWDGEGRDLWYTMPNRKIARLAEEAAPAATGPSERP